VIEAEQAHDLGGYQIEEDAGASGGAYVQSGGSVRYRILVESRGRWRLNLRTKAADDHGNSCYLTVDDRRIAAPPGIEHHHSVIQTTIGKWGWMCKWRESASVPITVDLTPGVHEISFSPREPQQLDKIVFQLGPGPGGTKGGLSGQGPTAKPHLLELPDAEDAATARLVQHARAGQVGRVLAKLDREAEDGELPTARADLRQELRGWVDTRLARARRAAEAGDPVTAVDTAELLAGLAGELPAVQALKAEAREWRKDPAYEAGMRFFGFLAKSPELSGKDFEAGLEQFRERYPAVPYARSGRWWFAP